jgi:hypothetical protein
MGRTTFDVSAFNRKAFALPDEARKAMMDTIVKSTDEAVNKIKNNLPTGPERNGHIRDTVKAERGRTVMTIDVVMGSAEQPYPAGLEWGHMVHGKHVPAQPVFFPAIKIVRKKHRARMRRAIKKVIATLFTGGGDA